MKELLIMYLLNICLTAIYFLYKSVIKKNVKKALLLSVFMLVVPFVGMAFLIVSEMIYIVLYKGRDRVLSMEELSFSQKRTRMIISNDIKKEVDVVPIEEALRISDTMDKRQMFLEVLKRPDVEDYMEGILDAVNHEDAEVVHYAAAYITDTIAKYKEDERKLRKLCEENCSLDILLTYLHFSKDMLDKHVFSEPEQKMYMDLFEYHLELLCDLFPEKLEGHLISKAISYQEENGNKKDIISKWIHRAEGIMEQDVTAAKEVLKYYFEKKEQQLFKLCMDRLKKSPLILDSELIEWVRFFG